MAIDPKYEKLVLRQKRNPLNSQSIVTCTARDLEDMEKVIGSSGVATLKGYEVRQGEIKYTGRVIFSCLYITQDGEYKKVECGADFTHKCQSDEILSGDEAKINFTLENIEIKMINGQSTFSAIVTANIFLTCKEEINYFSGDENLKIKREECVYFNYLDCKNLNYELADEFEAQGEVKNVFLPEPSAIVSSSWCAQGVCVCEGEVVVDMLLLFDGEEKRIKGERRCIPFRLELEAPNATIDCKCKCDIIVSGVKFEIAVDEDRGKSLVTTLVEVDIKCDCYERVSLNLPVDAFSLTNKLELFPTTFNSVIERDNLILTERFNGNAVLLGEIEKGLNFISLALPKMEIVNSRRDGDTLTIEGLLQATAIFEGENGLSSIGIELPLFINKNFTENENAQVRVKCMIEDVDAKILPGGEIEISGDVKLLLSFEESVNTTLLGGVKEGEEKVLPDTAISVYFAREGETLYSLAKSLSVSENEIIKLNPNLVFPLSSGQNVIIYRQKTIKI